MREASANSSWARGPDRMGYIGRPAIAVINPKKTEEGLDTNGLFSPRMESSPTLRNKVHSSSYGKVTPKPMAPIEPEEEEVEEAPTFKPDFIEAVSDLAGGNSKQRVVMRQKAQSSGYGRNCLPTKEKPQQENPTFRPNTGVTKSKKITKATQSTGYGKVIVPPRSNPKTDKPSFTPDLNVSKYSKKLRSKAVEKTYLQPARPRTAPATMAGEFDRTGAHVPKFTLAADRSEPPPEEEDDNAPFVLDGGALGLLKMPLPSPVKFRPLTKAAQIKENATSSGYGSVEYHPPAVELAEKTAMSKLNFGPVPQVTAQDLAIEGVRRTTAAIKLAQTVRPTYGEDYTPAQAMLPTLETKSTWKPAMKGKMSTAAELEAVEKSRLNDSVSSSCYGIASPEVSQMREPKIREPRLKFGTATTTMLSVEAMPKVKLNHLKGLASDEESDSDEYEDDVEEAHSDDDEQVTHFPL